MDGNYTPNIVVLAYLTISKSNIVLLAYLTASKFTSSYKEDKEEQINEDRQRKNIEQNEAKIMFEFETKRHSLALGLSLTVTLMKSNRDGRTSPLDKMSFPKQEKV
eukprot:4463356-Ditylum_brightwellii.AAC.1